MAGVVAKPDDASEDFGRTRAAVTASLTRRVGSANIPSENLAQDQGIRTHS